METIKLRPSRTPIVSGVSATSTPTVKGGNTHDSADFAAFLGHFDGLLTYQTFPDDKSGDKALQRIIHNATMEELLDLNKRGAGVYLMVSEGDGHGRKIENVTRVRAFCADFDGAALPETWQLEPSLITETSAGKYHAYWFLAADNNVLLSNDEWNAQQKAIAKAVGSKENDCTGINRVMRVPGFLHLKNPAAPFLSCIHSTTGQRYDLADITAAFPVQAPAAPQPRPALVGPVTPSEKPTTRQAIQRKYATTALQEECANLAATTEGHRNNTLNGTAYRVGRLVGGGHLDPDEARSALYTAALTAGLRDHEIAATLDSGLYGGIGTPDHLDHVGTRVGQRTSTGAPVGGIIRETTSGDDQDEDAPAPLSVAQVLAGMPDKPQLQHYHQLVLAEMRENNDVYRYNQTWRSWWEYKSGVYVEVNDEKMAQNVDRMLQKYGYTVKSTQVSEVAIKIAREPNVGSLHTDQGAWELNTRNGILDLKTGQLRDHTPDYYSIIQSAASYDPDATAPQWDEFLQQAVPDESDRTLLQMYAGLCLTGDTSPQKALFLIGEGGTGKGTFTRVLSAVLGDLATSSAIENIRDGSFLVSTLVGKRMCVVSEMPKYVDWLPFKRVTGEDTITVDVKYKTAYTTKLDIKLIILSNIMPVLGDDAANSSLTRRFLPISFNVTPAERDATLEERLTAPEELTGILNWMLDGLQLLQDNGMQFPSSTNALSREIVEQSNHVITWLQDCCTYEPDMTVTATEVYSAYRVWCMDNNIKPLSNVQFPRYLLAAGRHYGKNIDKIRKTAGVVYTNLRLTSGGDWYAEHTA